MGVVPPKPGAVQNAKLRRKLKLSLQGKSQPMGGKCHVPRPGSIVGRRQKKRRRRLGAISLPIERSPNGKRSQRDPRKTRSGTFETPARTPPLSRRGTTTARPPPGIMQQKSTAVGNPSMIADWFNLRAGNHASSPSRSFFAGSAQALCAQYGYGPARASMLRWHRPSQCSWRSGNKSSTQGYESVMHKTQLRETTHG